MTARATQQVWPEVERELALRRLRFASRSIGGGSEGIEIVLPAHVLEVPVAVLPQKAERRWRRFSRLTIVFALLSSILIGALTYSSYRVTVQGAANTTARADVLAAAQALEEMPDGISFQLMIRGPGFLPDSRGTRVSEGTMLFLERRAAGETYVRATQTGGTTTYYVHDGVLYAAPRVE